MFRVSTLDMLNLPRNDSGAIDYSQDFFGRETFLTVSGQLNVEGYCLAMSNVYTWRSSGWSNLKLRSPTSTNWRTLPRIS